MDEIGRFRRERDGGGEAAEADRVGSALDIGAVVRDEPGQGAGLAGLDGGRGDGGGQQHAGGTAEDIGPGGQDRAEERDVRPVEGGEGVPGGWPPGR
ncbi:hypothetical protein [Streptomyces sp. URMC 129]|uniref:hypothetical protein n=1 Tax=Streptomyces sp. URMC 129 TaxID=3423407 RepID=UPI003F1967EA